MSISLEKAKKRFESKLQRRSKAKCPLCERTSIVYKRVVDKTMATTLQLWAKEHGDSFIHVRRFLERKGLDSQARGGSFTKLRHWGLIESKGRQTGYWRITKKGFEYLSGRRRIHKVALVANQDGKVIGYLAEEGKVTIHDALNTKFNKGKL